MSAGPPLTWLMDLAETRDVYLFLQQGGWVADARRAWGGRNVRELCQFLLNLPSEPLGDNSWFHQLPLDIWQCAEGVPNVGHPEYT